MESCLARQGMYISVYHTRNKGQALHSMFTCSSFDVQIDDRCKLTQHCSHKTTPFPSNVDLYLWPFPPSLCSPPLSGEEGVHSTVKRLKFSPSPLLLADKPRSLNDPLHNPCAIHSPSNSSHPTRRLLALDASQPLTSGKHVS